MWLCKNADSGESIVRGWNVWQNAFTFLLHLSATAPGWWHWSRNSFVLPSFWTRYAPGANCIFMMLCNNRNFTPASTRVDSRQCVDYHTMPRCAIPPNARSMLPFDCKRAKRKTVFLEAIPEFQQHVRDLCLFLLYFALSFQVCKSLLTAGKDWFTWARRKNYYWLYTSFDWNLKTADYSSRRRVLWMWKIGKICRSPPVPCRATPTDRGLSGRAREKENTH